MTLRELSEEYRRTAVPVRRRLKELRQAEKHETDPEKRFWLKRRMLALGQALAQLNELAELCEHYYDRGYYRNEKYRL